VVLRGLLRVGMGKNIPNRVLIGRKEARSGGKKVTIWSAEMEGE
jgi:hypothetical protein